MFKMCFIWCQSGTIWPQNWHLCLMWVRDVRFRLKLRQIVFKFDESWIFQIRSKKSDLKSPGYVPLGAKLQHFGSKRIMRWMRKQICGKPRKPLNISIDLPASSERADLGKIPRKPEHFSSPGPVPCLMVEYLVEELYTQVVRISSPGRRGRGGEWLRRKVTHIKGWGGDVRFGPNFGQFCSKFGKIRGFLRQVLSMF